MIRVALAMLVTAAGAYAEGTLAATLTAAMLLDLPRRRPRALAA